MNRFFSMVLAAALPLSIMACSADQADADKAGTSIANVENDFTASDRLLAEVAMRQIVTKKLLTSEVEGEAVESYQYDILKAALEGPGDGNVVATVYSMSCERGLGVDYCTMGIGTDVAHKSPNDDETEAGYELRLRIYQGNVIGARLVLVAG